MKKALIILGFVIGSIILLPVVHLAVWALIPPLSPRRLAKTGHFVSVGGIDTYYERYGSGSPLPENRRSQNAIGSAPWANRERSLLEPFGPLS